MSHLWRFAHLLAFTLWLGGAAAVLVAGTGYRRLDRRLWGAVADSQAAMCRLLVGPGAILSVASGLMLTFRMYGALSGQVGAWLGSMQGLGLVAALVALLGMMPAAGRLMRLEPIGDGAAAFDMMRRRLSLSAVISGLLALAALGAGALYR